MTEIPVFPPGDAPEPPAPGWGEWGAWAHGAWQALHRIAAHTGPDERRKNRYEKHAAIWPYRVDPVPMPLTGPTGILDSPAQFSPSDGFWWDIHTISATGFTAGTVQGWINLPQLASGALQGALRASLTPTAPFANFGKGQLLIRATERVVFLAAGITGNVLISADVTQVADAWLGEYLL